MIRSVLDANVVVSGVLGFERAESAPGEIVRAWVEGEFALVVSGPLVDEIGRSPELRNTDGKIVHDVTDVDGDRGLRCELEPRQERVEAEFPRSSGLGQPSKTTDSRVGP